MQRRRSTPCLLKVVAAVAATGVAAGSPAAGGLVTYRQGEQDFAHGTGPVLVKAAKAAGGNEAFPFDGTVFGDDRSRKFGTVGFTYTFAPPATSHAGTLTLGLLGLDAPPGSPATVRLFLDGIEQPNDAFVGASSAASRSSASVVSVPVSAALLADGELKVTVKASRRSPGYPGNAIEADFSELSFLGVDGTPGGNPGSGGNPGGGGGPGEGGDPDDGNGPGGDNGGPGGGNGAPGSGGGNEPGPHPFPNPDNGGPGSGGGQSPPNAVPLPPAVLAGGLGLAVAAAFRRRFK